MGRRRSQSDHDQMVGQVVQFLQSNGYSDIKADITGHQQPTIITWQATGRGHIPDATSVRDKEFFLFEVETIDSINDQHTDDQWNIFATFARQHGANFWVVVPSGSQTAVNRRLALLGLKANVWEI